jgi:hypothetical protein
MLEMTNQHCTNNFYQKPIKRYLFVSINKHNYLVDVMKHRLEFLTTWRADGVTAAAIYREEP